MKEFDFNDAPLLIEVKEYLASLKKKFNTEIYLVKDICAFSEELIDRDFVGIKIKEDHIEEFIIYSEQSINFPFVFANFKSIKKLRLNGLKFARNFNLVEINTLQELEHLDLSYCHFQKSRYNRKFEFKLRNLRYLNLSNCIFEELISFSNLSKEIQTLKLTNIKIKHFPEDIINLINLEHLDFSNNPDLPIPNIIFQLKKLKILKIPYCKVNIENLNFEKLESLKELDLSSLDLTELPASLKNLQELEKLQVAYNKIKKISPFLFKLANLSYLDLSNNQITKIPSDISKLKKLRYLNLNFNNIRSLTESFSKLENLKEFTIINNQIKSLPDSFKSLKKLEILFLTNNKLEFFPQFIKYLTNLKELYISDNPIEDFYEVYNIDLKIDKKIILREVLLHNIYSFKNANFEKISDLSVLVGTNNSGKSNFFKAFLNIKPYKQISNEILFTNSDPEEARIELLFELSNEFLYFYIENMKIFYPKLRYVNLEHLKLQYKTNIIGWKQVLRNLKIELRFNENFTYVNQFGFHLKEDFLNLVSSPQDLREVNYKVNILNISWKNLRFDLNRDYMLLAGDNLEAPTFQISQIDSVDDIRSNSNNKANLIYFFWREFFEFYENIWYVSEFRNFDASTDRDIEHEKIDGKGANFPVILTDFCNNIPKNRDFLQFLLNKLYPDVNYLWTNLSGKTKIPFIQEFNDMKRTFDNVGKGIHQILIILTYLMQLEENTTLFIEEPELYIHPELQKKLLEIIRKFLPLHQIFITTHSPFYINSLDESLSIHEIKKREGASNVKNVDSENITEVFSDLGLAPSDLLMYNGLILVEGKRDFKLLNNLLAEFLISNHLEIISIEGKNKLHFFADHKILSKLIKLGFKFLIILDRDEGNQKILDTLPDDALKDNILLLPVREIENLYINPELITSFLIEHLSIELAESKLKEIIIESIDHIISMSLIDRVIRKSFLDKIPLQFHYRDKNELMNIECDNDEWLDNFYGYFQSKYWIENFKTENYRELFEEKKKFYKSIDKQKKWKIFPGKNIRPLLLENLKEELKISIPLEKLEELMKENHFVKEELLDKIKNHFSF